MKWWPSPAKLNLFLHITGRRADGYHELQSIFQMLDYGDRLAFEVIPNDGQIILETPIDGVANDDNLIVKAAKLLQHHTNTTFGCKIWLEKNLPMGGGIGGGSSNAATTLCVLNHLWQCGLSDNELAKLGLQLGADVPVFVHGNTAFASGVGEQLTPVKIPSAYYLVVFPNCHISTAAIFGAPELPRNSAKIEIDDYDFDLTRNDCQDLVINRYPKVAKLLQWLINYAPSRMTGTGACVFATFEQESDALAVMQQLPPKWQGFVAKGVECSPLKLALGKHS
ncbi:4-(cytidine 5'-diphospho)-2-C-methyl-D-erythritol kinase [Alteromonas facilis]|uniref:4-(cytidine 5'-diphospho)-2-C-methyl-D-erythritol kinase n=1 Tax=Alteromonas facilis TaxID=2048004 RepID=UPI00196B8270|nr:4-(cytidine 5'-diphospho)-2-C-methyl-D-erythritol kinase [Alteromonas facilis]